MFLDLLVGEVEYKQRYNAACKTIFLIDRTVPSRRNHTNMPFAWDIHLQKSLKHGKSKDDLAGIETGHGPNFANSLKVVSFPIFPHI